MKKIEAIIRSSKLEQVRQSLHLHGVDGMTISEVRGVGREQGRKFAYRGAESVEQGLSRIKVEVVVEDGHADETVDAIYHAAHTGEVGDGRILVIDVANVVRIRTGETHGALHLAGR